MGYFSGLAEKYGLPSFCAPAIGEICKKEDGTVESVKEVTDALASEQVEPVAADTPTESESLSAPSAAFTELPADTYTPFETAENTQKSDIATKANLHEVKADANQGKESDNEQKLVSDKCDGKDEKAVATSDDKAGSAPKTLEERKAEHEKLEAQRKAEWEAKQKERKDEEDRQWQAVLAMSTDEIGSASAAHVSASTEKLTRRNMKICVSEHIKKKCTSDLDFARKAMHPRKNMVNCFRYINKKALDFIKQEMEDNDEKPASDGFGSDVPDDLCYQWAVEYFSDMDAEIDKREDEEFVSKPFYGGGTTAKKTKKKAAPKKTSKKTEAPVQKESKKEESSQLSLLDVS